MAGACLGHSPKFNKYLSKKEMDLSSISLILFLNFNLLIEEIYIIFTITIDNLTKTSYEHFVWYIICGREVLCIK